MSLFLRQLRRLRTERDVATQRAKTAEKRAELAEKKIVEGINERNRLWFEKARSEGVYRGAA